MGKTRYTLSQYDEQGRADIADIAGVHFSLCTNCPGGQTTARNQSLLVARFIGIGHAFSKGTKMHGLHSFASFPDPIAFPF